MVRPPKGAGATLALVMLLSLCTGSACGELSEMSEDVPLVGPTLEQVSPNEGPTIGGIQIELLGAGFAIGASVSVQGVSASNVTVWSGTRITATLPKQPGFFGNAPIAVTNPDGSTARRTDLFRYYLGAFPFRTPLLELGDGSLLRADATDAAIGDLNQDGVPDIAVTGGIGVTLLLSNGRGGYTASNQMATGQAPIAVAIADLDVNGRPDVVVANRDSGTVSVLVNNGQTILSRFDFSAGHPPLGLAVRDVDGDGLLDVATRSGAGEVRVQLGDGRGRLLPSFSDVAGVVSASAFTPAPPADFNGDGSSDPFTLQNGATARQAVGLLLSGASGGAGQDLWLDLPSAKPFDPNSYFRPPSTAVGDLNQDGVTDLVSWTGGFIGSGDPRLLFDVAIGQKGGDLAYNHRFVGHAGVTWPPASASTPISFVLGDANGDHALDIIYLVSTFSEKFIAVALNDGTGWFGSPIISPHSGGYPALAAGDWNGDGKLDVAFPGADSTPLMAFLGDGTGRFTEYFRAIPVNRDTSRPAIVTGDFNGDGRPDVVTGRGDGTIVLYLGTGTGGFVPARVISPYKETDGLHAFAVGDLNNDGRSDLIAATWASQNGWHVFLGSTSEGLLAGIQYRFNEFAIGGVTIADFNQDQRQDMVIFGLYGDPPRIYWGDGNGGFRGYTTFRLEPAMFGFAADVNNDGKPDLLTRLGLSTINTRVIINSAL